MRKTFKAEVIETLLWIDDNELCLLRGICNRDSEDDVLN